MVTMACWMFVCCYYVCFLLRSSVLCLNFFFPWCFLSVCFTFVIVLGGYAIRDENSCFWCAVY